MASPTKAISFNDVTVKISDVKKKKKYDSGTIGLAAARAFKAGEIYKIENGEVVLRPPTRTVVVNAKSQEPPNAPRPGAQSPAPPEPPK